MLLLSLPSIDITEDRLPSDEEANDENNYSSNLTGLSSFSLHDLEVLLQVVEACVSSLSPGFLLLELGRELIALMMNTVIRVAFYGTQETLRYLERQKGS